MAKDNVKFFTGHGASEEELERGFIRPAIEEKPEHDAGNYRRWFSEPKGESYQPPMMGSYGPDKVREREEFKNRHRESKGFLSRSHYVKEI